MSYLRDKTRPQADRPIYQIQDNFGGGLNLDTPATDIDKNEVIGSENYIWDERYGTGRPGSVEIDTLEGSGTLHGRPFYHPKEKCLVFHRGTQLFRWDGASAVEIKGYAPEGGSQAPFGENGESTINAFGEDVMIFTVSGGIYRILLSGGANKFVEINNENDSRPRDLTKNIVPGGTDLQAPFKYRYAYTFSTIIDASGDFPTGSEDRLSDGFRIVWESPPVPSTGTVNLDEAYFRLLSFATEIDNSNSQTLEMGAVDLANVPAFTYISHISWYRTVDLGQNGADGVNSQQFGWVGDALIDRVLPSNTSLTDAKTDVEIAANILTTNLRLSNIDWVEFKGDPDSSIGSVNEQFIFAAPLGGQTLSYSQRVRDELVGFHAGFQSHTFNDAIRILGSTPDILTIICNNTTHITSLTSKINVGALQPEFLLDHFDDIDKKVGVQDVGSFVEVEQGTYIAICSDRSVRVWNGAGWTRDLSLNTIGEQIISKAVIGITVSVYSDGAYFIWIDANNLGFPDTCLRLSLKRSSGRGWTTYTGTNWIFPPVKWGAFVGDNFLVDDGVDVTFTFVINRTDNKIYWIETFKGPTGKTINGFSLLPFYADKVSGSQPNGFDIECRVKPAEKTGARESFNIIHQESHAYMRDIVDPLKFNITNPITYPVLKVDARAFVDGFLVDVETAGEVNPGDDIQFWYRVEGSRIAIEFQSNRSGHQIRRVDNRFRVQDILRPGRAPSANVSEDFQDDFQTGLKLWMFTRPSPFLDRVALSKISSNGVATVLGPDSRSLGSTLTGAGGSPAPYIKSNTTVFDAFTYNVWIKTPVLTGGGRAILLKVNGVVQSLTITLSLANVISTTEFGGAVAVDDPTTGTGNVNGWSQFIFVRVASAAIMNVYQNDVLKGTLPVTTSFGGGDLEIGGVI